MSAALAAVYLAGVRYELVLESGSDPTVAALVATPAPEPAGPPLLAVVGDSFTSVDWTPGGEAAGWPARVAEVAEAQLVNLARGGAGYVRASATTFTYAATQIPAGADVVVVFGGANDAGHAVTDVEAAAAATFATVQLAAPDATLIVVGPQPLTAPAAAGYLELRDRVRAAALRAGAVFVDPIAERWFAEPQLVGPDGLHPSAAGHAFMAEQLEPRVRAALGPAS